MPPTHERQIPSVAALAAQCTPIETYSELSFAVATSLAAAKRLTWDQTPWLNPKLGMYDCHQIAGYLTQSVGKPISIEAVRHAFFLGETYLQDAEDSKLGTFPQLYAIFPYLTRDVSHDEKFLDTWQTEIVIPAYRIAWEDSGLYTPPGPYKEQGGSGRFIFPSNDLPQDDDERHASLEKEAAKIRDLFTKNTSHRVHAHWPQYRDFWGPGYEGKHTDARAKLFDEAWESMMGMLKGHSDMVEFQDPVLFVVYRARNDFGVEMSKARIYETIGGEWDKGVDSRYLLPGSFKVLVQTVLGTEDGIEQAVDEEDEEMLGDMVGVPFKRMAEEEAGGREKRIKHA